MRAHFITTALAAATLLAALPAHAATFTFTGNGNWSDPANWLNNLIPPNDATSQITFAPTSSSAVTSTADAGRSAWVLNSLTLNRSGSAADSITTAPGTSLHFEGANPFISLSSFSSSPTLAGAITSDAQLTLKGSSGLNVATISADITAPGLLLTSGNFKLSGNNTLADGITLAPTSTLNLLMGPDASLGTTPITVNLPTFGTSAFLQLTPGAGSQSTFSTPLTINGGSDPVFAGGSLAFNSSSAISGPYTFIFPSLTANAFATLQNRFGGSAITVAFQSVTLNGTASFSGNFALSNVSGAGGLTSGSLPGTLTLATANTFTGGTLIKQQTLLANATGALSAGPVQIDIGGVLVLNASAAANSDITSPEGPGLALGSVGYNANGAAGGHHIFAQSISLGATVTDLGGDSFIIPNAGYLAGNSASLGLLTRGTNLTVAAGTQIENTDGALPTVATLGSSADLILALHTTTPFNVSIGAGTPWGGIAGGHGGAYVGTVTALSDISLAGGALGDGTAASFNIHAASPVVVHVTSATLSSPSSDYSGVASFDVTGSLELASANALGGGNASSPAPVTVESAGVLSVRNSQAINAPVTLHAGSTLTLFAPGLTGSGVISHDAAGITFDIENSAAFSGAQLAPSAISAADVVVLSVSDLPGLPSLNPAATYVLNSSTQAAGFTLNGGTLRFGSSTALNAAATGDNTLHVGDLGAVFQAPSPFSQASLGKSLAAVINIPIVATGPVTFGTLDPNATRFFNGSSGTVILTAANTLPSVTVSYAGLAVPSQAALGNGPVTLNHGFLDLYPVAPPFPGTTAVYANSLTVLGDSILSDASQATGGSAFHQQTAATLSVGDVRLAAALELSMQSSSFTLNSLTPLADATLASDSTSRPTTLGSLNADTSPHTLTFLGNRGLATFIVTGATADTGPIVLNDAVLILRGSVASSTSPITLTDNSSLSSTAPVNRPLVVQDASLGAYAAGAISTRDLTLSSNTLLQFALNSPTDPNNTLFHVQGDLTLDGLLALQNGASPPPGDYTLFTYTGSLTDDGLTLPSSPALAFSLNTTAPGSVILHVAAVPEPASLSLLSLTLPLLLRRRARNSSRRPV